MEAAQERLCEAREARRRKPKDYPFGEGGPHHIREPPTMGTGRLRPADVERLSSGSVGSFRAAPVVP